MKKKIKVYLNTNNKDGKIVPLSQIVEADLIADRKHSMVVELPDGNAIIRKKPHQVVGQK